MAEALFSGDEVVVEVTRTPVQAEDISHRRRKLRRFKTAMAGVLCALLGALAVVAIWWFGFERDAWDESAYDGMGPSIVAQGRDERYGAYVEVPGHGISYPVVQGDDNQYYLYHDLDGNKSYTTVFLDARATWDGLNKLIYGHTLVSGGMFRPIAEAYKPDVFAGIDEVKVTASGESEAKSYKPLCALNVDPYYETIQTFDFAPSQEDFEAACKSHAEQMAAAGQSNATTKDKDYIEENDLVAYAGLGQERGVDGKLADVYRIFVCDEEEQQGVLAEMEVLGMRDWLEQLCADAEVVTDGAAEQIEAADDTVVLACCSWPFNSTRTLLVCTWDAESAEEAA